MATIDYRLGSYDFDTGNDAGGGKILLFVLGATDQDDAVAQADASGKAPDSVNGYLKAKTSVQDQGGTLFFVDYDYQRSVPNQATADSGTTPGSPPSGQQTPGKDPNDGVGRDVSFTTGGATKKIYVSLNTRYKVGRNAGAAPNFQKLIGVDIKGGKVEGCEVIAPASDFTVTKRFGVLTVGWFRNMLATVATTNDASFLGLARGEVLFKGCDGQYKDGDPNPWTVTGRFGFSPNKDFAANPDELTLGEIELPEVRGWEYIWTIYQQETESVTIAGVARDYVVQRPLFAYVEQVYPEASFTKLHMG